MDVRDRLDRPLADLRVSVTDRCNLRCRYCMPREVYGADHRFLPRAEVLSFEEVARLARVFARLGVRKLRLTGGEPLLRRQLDVLVAMLAGVEGIEEIALTTNGLLLASRAHALARAGLTRATVSLDALDDRVLASIADAPLPARRVLEAVDAALDAGLAPVKVNMVVRRGVNDGCVIDMAAHFRNRPVVVRFIEFMDVGATNGWRLQEVVPAAEIVAAISARWPLEPLERSAPGEVASRYRYRDGGGEIGVIHSVSKPFCASCTRARLSADGKLFTCLFARRGHDLRALLRDGVDDAELERRVREVWTRRVDRYSAQRAAGGREERAQPALRGGRRARPAPAHPKIEMSYIGG